MGCLLTTELLNNCINEFGVGGIQPRVWIANTDELETIDLGLNGEVINITKKNLGVSPTTYGKFYRFDNVEFQNAGGFTAKKSANKNYEHSITMVLRGIGKNSIETFHQLFAAQKLTVIIQSRNPNTPPMGANVENSIFLFGAYNGLTVQDGSTGTFGPGADVLSGLTVNLLGVEVYPAREIEPDYTIYNAPNSLTPVANFLEHMIDDSTA